MLKYIVIARALAKFNPASMYIFVSYFEMVAWLVMAAHWVARERERERGRV